jgi:subtilisin family serine protease
VSALSDFDGKPGGIGVHSQSCPAGFSRDRDDVLANFSNYGRDVDLMAPGKCIWSTNKDGGYRAMSGTSMATPLVTGAVALYVIAHPNWTFSDIRAALIACGTADWRTSSDHDRFHEPVLNISRLC